MESADEYASKYKRISLYVRKRVSAAIKVEEDSNSILHVYKRKFQLPTFEFKKFGGDIKDWLTFCGQFKKIDEDPEMDDDDKFQYLLQATTPKTRTREVVESFPPVGSNYSKAMECLKARFGREELLVEFYVIELLKSDSGYEFQRRRSIRINTGSLYRNVSILNYKRDKDNVS